MARRLTDGTVLRISVSRATAGMLALGMLQPMLVVLVAALIFAGLMAGRLSRRIVDPLNRWTWSIRWKTTPTRSWLLF